MELVDESGDKVTVIFEGCLSREKILQLADLAELYGGNFNQRAGGGSESKLDRLLGVVEKYFPFGYFTSRDVLEAFQAEFRESIPLTTVSTYLCRLADRAALQRVGSGRGSIRYRVSRGAYTSSHEQRIAERPY